MYKLFYPVRYRTEKFFEFIRILSNGVYPTPLIGEAPVLIVCCAETNGHVMACGQQCYPIDVAIAIDHLSLCAAVEGLGTCWIGAFDEGKVKEILDIPKGIRVVELLPLGYPRDPSPVNKIRFPLHKIMKYEQL
jgi:nitroreductase